MHRHSDSNQGQSKNSSNYFGGNRGSAIIEAVLTLPSVILIISSGLFLSYIVFANFWLKFYLYESFMCIAEGNSASHCEMKMHKAVTSMLPIGNVTSLHLRQDTIHISGNVSFQISPKFCVRKRSSLEKVAIHANTSCCL